MMVFESLDAQTNEIINNGVFTKYQTKLSRFSFATNRTKQTMMRSENSMLSDFQTMEISIKMRNDILKICV